MVYIINALLILAWAAILPEDKNKKKYLCILYCVQWILISGLRAYTVGADTYSYKTDYDKVFNMSWDEVWLRFVNYFHGTGYVKDPGYQVFEKVCQIFTGDNYTLYLLIIAVIFTVPMTVWIYKYSDNVCLSFLIYSALFYAFFAITGHRQTIATALVLFGGYECMKKNKIVPLILLHVVAFFIHKSSICFIILYFARFVKINKWYWIIATTGIVLAFVFKSQMMSLLGTVMGYDQYIDQFEDAGTYKFTFFLMAIYVLTMITYHTLPKNIDTHYSAVALTLAVFFTPLTYVDPNAMRVVQYFSVFMMILVPRMVESFNPKFQVVAKMASYAVLVGALIISMPEYSFVFMQ